MLKAVISIPRLWLNLPITSPHDAPPFWLEKHHCTCRQTGKEAFLNSRVGLHSPSVASKSNMSLSSAASRSRWEAQRDRRRGHVYQDFGEMFYNICTTYICFIIICTTYFGADAVEDCKVKPKRGKCPRTNLALSCSSVGSKDEHIHVRVLLWTPTTWKLPV